MSGLRPASRPGGPKPTHAVPPPSGGSAAEDGRAAAARRTRLEVRSESSHQFLLHSRRTARVLSKRRFLRDGQAAATMAARDLAGWQSALGASWVQLGLGKDVLGQLLVELSFGDLLLQARKGEADQGEAYTRPKLGTNPGPAMCQVRRGGS